MEPISLKESAMVRCLPVTTDYGGVAEKEFCLKSPGDPNDPETQAAVAHRVVALLKDQTTLEELSQNAKQLAQKETWDKIATLWIDHMKE